MTIRTPIDKQHVQHHFTYNLWKYVMVVIVGIVGWSLIYTQTAYRSPQEKRIDLYVKSSTVSVEMSNQFLEPIWKEVTPEMEVVETVAMGGGNDYPSLVQLQVYLAAGEGDIYFLPAENFKAYASGQAFIPLDDLIADGTINAEGIDTSSANVQITSDLDEQGNPIYTGESATFGIPMDSLFNFMEGMQLDNRGMVMCIAVNNGNDENVIPFFNALLQAGRGEKPEWLAE